MCFRNLLQILAVHYDKYLVIYIYIYILFIFFHQASKKKMMIQQGVLNKYGKANEKTPANWKEGYTDFGLDQFLCSFLQCVQVNNLSIQFNCHSSINK